MRKPKNSYLTRSSAVKAAKNLHCSYWELYFSIEENNEGRWSLAPLNYRAVSTLKAYYGSEGVASIPLGIALTLQVGILSPR